MGEQMQIGCQMAFNDFTSPKYIAEAAQFVEQFGFAEFWVPEHVMFFPTYDITYDLKQASYPKEPYVSFLDHILISNSLVQNKNYSVKTLPFDDYMGSFNVYEQYISDHMPVLLSIY